MPSPISFPLHKAGRILRNGGVVAYPTEGVFGLGCLPGDTPAIERILLIKHRRASRGLILIAANRAQLEPWIEFDGELPSDPELPVTWVVPASEASSRWITGGHAGVAVRVTTHPVATALCNAAGSALVSTSANIAGQRPAANTLVLRRQFRTLVDYIVPGHCGTARGPSEIRDMMSGATMRPAKR